MKSKMFQFHLARDRFDLSPLTGYTGNLMVLEQRAIRSLLIYDGNLTDHRPLSL